MYNVIMNEAILNRVILVFYTILAFQFLYAILKNKSYKGELLLGLIIFPITYFVDSFLIGKLIEWYSGILKDIRMFDSFSLGSQFFILFLAFDFFVYWTHRIYHSSDFFWCNHIIHHSGKHYSPHLKFRESFVTFLPTIFMPFFFLIGFDLSVIMLNFLLILLVDTFNHFEIKRRIPFVEYFIVTPRVHRLHHHIRNKKEVKNYGNITLIWDHLFGTFELPTQKNINAPIGVLNYEEPKNPIYACLKPFMDYFRGTK